MSEERRYPEVCSECRRYLPGDSQTGECRRKAPSLRSGSTRAVWPIVSVNGVACGEGSLRPELRGGR